VAKKETLGTDAHGRYRRYLGWKFNGVKLVQHLFRLGRDVAPAKAANLRLEQLWEAVVARWRRQHAEGKTADHCPLWDDTTLTIGAAIARGQTTCTLTPPDGGSPTAAATWLAILQGYYPMIGLRLPDKVQEEAVAGLQRQSEGIDQSRRIAEHVLAVLGQPAGQHLHEALDAYSAFIGEKYKDKPSNRPQQTAITLLKKHAEDFPLSKLDADRVETWLAYWCRRPAGYDTTRPLALTTCRNTLIVLRQFLRWLSRSPAFDWQVPGGFSFPRCKIAKTPADRLKKRGHFNLGELKIIWEYAKPWERALILLALNCGFSKREIATLQPEEIVAQGAHTYVKRHRVKTDVYAEWVLWPETLQALDCLAQSRPEGSTYVVVNQAGNPLSRGTPTGNENQVIKNHWDNLFKRIKADHPEFSKLPFKHLRKTGATLLRHLKVENAAELASMYLAHGDSSDNADQLLGVYAARPWRKLHKALLRLRKKLLPVFEGVAEPWEYKMNSVSPKVREKVLALRAEGKTQKEIAAEVGLHWTTVGKICRSSQ
jgi:integrase